MASVTRTALTQYLNELLKPEGFKDYCPNGLQVEGRSEIGLVVCGVTANQALLDLAVAEGADAILVHHGWFWRGETGVVTGIKRNRLKTLLTNDINLYAYHLPLDAHPAIGNNAGLARAAPTSDARRRAGMMRSPSGWTPTSSRRSTPCWRTMRASCARRPPSARR